GLARARFPLAEQRLAHAQCEERGGGDAVVGEVPDVLEQSRQLGGRGNGGVGCSGGGAGGGGFGRHSLTLGMRSAGTETFLRVKQVGCVRIAAAADVSAFDEPDVGAPA